MLAIAAVAVLLALPRQRSLRQQYALRRMGAEIDGGYGIGLQDPLSWLIFGSRDGDKLDALRFDSVALSDADTARLALFPLLHTVRLHNCPDPDRSIAVLVWAVPHLSWLEITDTPLNDLRTVSWFHNLIILDLKGTSVSDESLGRLGELYYLSHLDLQRTMVHGPGLAALKGLPRLKSLNLSACPIDDRGLEYLKGFPALERLRLRRTNVSREAVERLQQSLPECEIETDFNAGKKTIKTTDGT